MFKTEITEKHGSHGCEPIRPPLTALHRRRWKIIRYGLVNYYPAGESDRRLLLKDTDDGFGFFGKLCREVKKLQFYSKNYCLIGE